MVLEDLRGILFYPTRFFEDLRYEFGFKRALRFYIFLELLISPLHLMVALSTWTFAMALSSVGIGVLIRILSAFIFAAFAHFFVFLFGGNGGIEKTYQAMLFGVAPVVVLAWVPTIAIVASTYALYTVSKGLAILHDLSLGKAVGAYLSSLLIPALLFFAVSGVFL